MTQPQHYGLQPADKLIEPLAPIGPATHHSIYLGEDSNGQEWFSENVKQEGVRLITAEDFFYPGRPIRNIVKFQGTPEQRKAAVQRALAEVGHPYNLINYNCEHFARQVQTGKPRSLQVERFVGITLFLLILMLIQSE
jgi:hypothetical protein